MIQCSDTRLISTVHGLIYYYYFALRIRSLYTLTYSLRKMCIDLAILL